MSNAVVDLMAFKGCSVTFDSCLNYWSNKKCQSGKCLAK